MKNIDEVFINGVSSDEFFPLVGECVSDCDNEAVLSQEKEIVPVLPLRNMVLFPGVIMPISVAREKSLRLVREQKNDGLIAVFAQKRKTVDDPKYSDLYKVGTIAKIVKVLDLPDNTTTVIVEGKVRVELLDITEEEPYLKGKVKAKSETAPHKQDNNFIALTDSIKELSLKIVRGASNMPNEMSFAIKNIDNDLNLINYICANFWFKITEKQRLIETSDLMSRGMKLLDLLSKESQLLDLKLKIQAKAKEEIDEQQKDYYLQQQMKAIQDQLGIGRNSDIDKYVERAKKKKWSKTIREVFDKEVAKLERLNPTTPDYGVESTYIDTLLNVPFGEFSKDSFDMKKVRKQLDADHYGLDNVKERIIEHLSVLKLKGDMKAPIICLYGAPGVGKTSLGKSIATAIGRKYIRVSLGGVHDEAEIRGHRRTYIGALPGRIVKNLIKAGTSNPVFLLDEVDKVAESSINGDPASALLEVLDPEQNNAFHDNYLDVDVDLSKVMFIATANSLEKIPRPLLDRMELIEVSGYVEEEKVVIAQNYLINKQEEANGLKKGFVKIEKDAVKEIIASYTRESGVRELERKIGKVMRKIACKVASGEDLNEVKVKKSDLTEYLGNVEYLREKYEGNGYCGVVTGLAWTAVGGEILYIESSLNKAKTEGKLTLTGNLGDVMKESAMLAYEYLKSNAKELGIDDNKIETYNVHIHVPEGAVPKDGPSAGVTIATSLLSSFKEKKVRKGLAMTGEITLRGKVMPVGGIKEKILAAKRAGITDLVLCQQNKRDIDKINPDFLKGLTFHYVEDIKEVFKVSGLL
ncbi:MAG: endopeptidase La [Paludibacteraceae bacterium]|nr:endopeptidase La [Paludibacteraceae bacterium]